MENENKDDVIHICIVINPQRACASDSYSGQLVCLSISDFEDLVFALKMGIDMNYSIHKLRLSKIESISEKRRVGETQLHCFKRAPPH